MKGKVLSLKIILCMLVLVTAGFCFGVGVVPKNKSKIYAASTKVEINDDEYSALFSGGVIFSTEKVLIGDYNSLTPNVKTFVGTEVDQENKVQEKPYYFKNLQNGNENKTVIDNGQFAVMENVIDSSGNLVKEQGSNEQEAIMVSFGAYVYLPETVDENGNTISPEEVQIADEDKTIYSRVTYLDVVLEKDGEIVPNDQIPSNRNISTNEGGPFFDFVYLIQQDKNGDNEGFYKFTLNYMIGSVEYEETFEFYIVNMLSYTQTANPEGKDFGYEAEPTLGWTGGSSFEQTEAQGYVRYYIGKSGIQNEQISYPTITYDYTKYKLSYTHTANQRNTTYDFTCQFNKTLNNQTAQLNYVVSSSAKTYEGSFALKDYNVNSNINLVTIVLTEPGTYVVNYDFIYDGYNAEVAPNIGIYPENITLSVHGLSALYSKTDYESAKLQYFELATKTGNHVDLFIPNAYELNSNIEDLKDQELGFVYSLVESEEREGNVLTENSINSFVNFDLKTSNNFASNVSDYDLLVSNLANLKDADEFEQIKEYVNTIAENIKYVSTNQGSIWLAGNDSYTTDSFYYYSPTKLTADALFETVTVEGNDVQKSTAKSFTNTTSFNTKGYYLVFLNVKPSGITGDAGNYWQIFAFQYTSSSVDIKLEAINDDETTEIVAGGKHTNKEVRVSWKKPGIFDRNIQGYYYSITNNNADRDTLLATQKNKISANEISIDGVDYYSTYLGSSVKDGDFVKYLIRLESEGDSATHKIFTVDRQPISGVQPYLVEEMFSGNSVFYSFATDSNNYPILISNSITDSYAAVTWDDKLSGAETFASYSYTPFVQNGNASTKVTGNWITTNYELGATIEGSSLTKASLDAFNLSSESILFNQGIYIIKIWDSAGNVCFYSFVIDKTENYFEIDGNFVTNSSLIFGDNVNFNIGQYKAFELTTDNAELNSFIQKATENKLAEFNENQYYTGTYNNASIINKYFQKVGDKYFFTVKNTNVVGFDTAQEIDEDIYGISGQLVYDVFGESYYKRTLYAVAENQTYSTNNDVKNSSYVTVEINKDNARGMVYYSSVKVDESNIPSDGSQTDTVKRLDTGSDLTDAEGKEIASGMIGARATSAPHISFVWNMGTGNFEVEKVSYTFYSLKPNQFNSDNDGKYYFYGSPETDISLYESGVWSNNAKAMADNSGRGIVSFNGSNESRAGLYVVTRTYRDDLSVDLGDDVRVKNYYFIIDRNQIIDVSQSIGSNIEIHLLENEIEFNEFSTGGTEVQTFSNVEDKINNQRYNIYLNTTKLPTVLNVPTGKYFSTEGNSSGYYAGKLNVSVYFADIYGQLDGQFKNKTVKLFDSANATTDNGIFVVDIYKYLTDINKSLRDRIAESDLNGTWLFLSGDYIIRISDNVQNELGKVHEKFIGMRITGTTNSGPQVDSYTDFDEVDMITINANADGGFKYSATVSQEYLKVELPAYVDNVVENAQVDPNYIVIKQYYGENAPGTFFVNHPYEPKNGINLKDTNSEIITHNSDGSINIWLDTKLRNANGDVDLENLNIPLYYTITVRYKIGNDSNPEKYQNCYVYYDTNGQLVKFYEATYTIRIDREAPKANIEILNNADALVEEYNEMFETDSMIENGVHETSSNLYFTKQYAKYYQTGKTDKGYIYAYQVDANTTFDSTDVSAVYYKLISVNELADLKNYNLTLPLINEAGYTKEQGITFSSYAGLGLVPNNYYEIVEMDSAGNATQYVIHYEPSFDNDVILIPVSILRTKNNKEISGNIGLNGFEVNVVANADENDQNGINIYDLTALGNASVNGANFIKIELKHAGGDEVLKILTTATTDFGKINQQIVDALKAEQYGNFNLVLTVRNVNDLSQKSFNINLYDKTQIIQLKIEKLVKVVDGAYYIDLAGANEQNADQTLWFFAQNITIKSSLANDSAVGEYVGEMKSDRTIVYSNKANGQVVNGYIPCQPDTTYFITMSDGIQEELYKYRFRTTEELYYFYNVAFENPLEENVYGEFYSQGTNNVYYGYTSAMVEYDKTFTAKLFIKEEDRYVEKANTGMGNIDDLYYFDENDKYITINLNANYENAGSVLEARVDIYAEDDVFERSYEIVIDTKLSSVALRDYNSGEQRDIIEIFNNVEYDDETVRSDKSGSGIMNLQWNKIEENDYFDYVYTLYELKKDDTYVQLDLTNVSNQVIATKEDSKGIYKFEIAVLSKDGTFLGNRVFAFEVQEVSTQIYYVRNEEGVAIKENSSFKLEDLTEEMKTQVGTQINPNISLPLYITNENLTIVVTAMNVDLTTVATETLTGYTFKIYKLSKENSFNIFLGVLKINEKEKVFENAVNIIKSNESISTMQPVDETTSFTVSGAPTDTVTIKSNVTPITNAILKKNLLLVEVYYNNDLVKTEILNNETDPTTIVYEIDGNGQYAFVFKDLAGNIHKFDNGSTRLNIYVLREVVVTVNDVAPIENAFYDEAVTVSVYASTRYVTGSISVVASKNGEAYVPEGFNPYVFSDYGTYRVVITALYNDGALEQPIELKKVVTFTIINVKEARKSIDLTSLNGSTITKVFNTYGEDKTEEFLAIINGNNGGMNISYENVIKYADQLNVTAGKITFTITYVVEDGIYPNRAVEFSFTLNNETPTIECSLEKGESTKKNFKIYFNAAILYEQIGEAYIYINDREVAYINENSANTEVVVTTSFKQHGDGDYYVKLVSSSGVVWDSYKVTIKEPLNFWAIVVIIVIVGVIATVVITIIVLRRKMRIR